ncbi:hypothetical protein QYE76_042148 [Lolium multiflorum]|uniref:DUF4283 domain-containing protein n=1 Tax=Lolium multiflorum TaxID=4521 RepID=A0AAD8WUN1_LOLMU|nr:hypothetical protein QYE76_042148 [Lolium multiflorum]
MVEAWNDDPEPVEVLKEAWIKMNGLQTKWCEWSSLAQAISVCGLLLDVDWLSVFRNNAQEVRVKVHCRDPSKLPPGRLFGYHGNLFHLGFTLESVIPTAKDNDDLLGEELEEQGRKDNEEVSVNVNEEVKKFWYSEKMLSGNLSNQMEEAVSDEKDDQGVELPDDIMPDVELPFLHNGQVPEVPPAKKKSKWGPVQPVRQSNRIDRSKNIMEKAQEMKKINNLEILRMKGIMSNNPFNILQVEELDNAGKIVGINLDIDSDSMHSACSSPRAASLSDKEQQEELTEEWIDVIRKSRGKHPKKFYP